MADDTNGSADALVALAADIVSAYVSHNAIGADALPRLIADTHTALKSLYSPPPTPVQKQEPAVSIRKSVTPDYIICLEDGLKFKSLKRHLRHKFDLTPEQYRAKWNLPADYPMVAPAYSASRSAMAKSIGLGRKVAPAAKPPGRRRKASVTSS